MDPFRTHGAPSWSELLTTDPAAAASFYRELLGWEIEPMDMEGGQYHVVKVAGEAHAGIMTLPPGSPPRPPSWGVYVTVDDVDASAKRVTALGGQVLLAPTDVVGVGRFALVADPQGAMLHLITYGVQTGD